MGNASTDSLTRYWASLPEELRAKLRLGFVGKRHLLDIAGWCIRSESPAFTPVAVDALQTVIRENPLDGAMARELLGIAPALNLLDQAITDRLTCLTDNWHLPRDFETYRQLQAGRDFEAIKNFLLKAIATHPDNLFWREQALTVGCFDRDADFISEAFKSDRSSEVDEILLGARAISTSLFNSNVASETAPMSEELSQRPWDTQLLLRTYDKRKGVSERRESVPGSVAVLLYSWNKADELDATLASLSRSDLGRASVFVLDNGSTDRTAEVILEWESRFANTLGEGKITTISLPVNIGAAAARNWLLHEEAVLAHDFVCYLDDDVELPKDWLSLLGAAAAEYPEAGVWGCKVVDHTNPLLIQSADSHLLANSDQQLDLTKAAPNPFKLSDLHIQTLDSGSFDYMRPCASVTGCCHLFRTRTLLESGDFAIQLSPSQYDDMEHDLRLCESGLFPVYQGHLSVRHKKRTGVASLTSMQEEGNAIGNKYKMQTMHAPADTAAASAAEQKLLDEDILRKLAYLDKA